MKRALLAAAAVLAVVAALLAPAAAATGDISSKVYYGSSIPITDAPWQVAVRIWSDDAHTSYYMCGGSLIRDTWIVTAAHCVNGDPVARISYGAGQSQWSSQTFIAVKAKYVHPQYNASTDENDIALLELNSPVVASSSIGMINLPIAQSRLSPVVWPAVNTSATVTGWGQTQSGNTSNALQRGNVVVLAGPQTVSCTGSNWGSTYDASTMLCAEGNSVPVVDTCGGDSGGPLTVVVNGLPILAGLTSFGGNVCSDPSLPGIYTRVTTYVDWIIGHTGDVTVPMAPSAVTASAGKASASVSWTPGATGGLPISKYVVTASSGQTCEATAALNCTIAGLQPGIAVTFTVVAHNSEGDSPASAPSNSVVPYAAPGQVSNVQAVAKTGKLEVSWDPPAANGDASISYSLTIKPAASPCAATSATSCTYSGLVKNQPYEIVISASNAGGEGVPSVPVVGVPLSALKSKGDTVKDSKLNTYSGLKTKNAKMSYKLGSGSSGVCKLTSSGVKLTKKKSTCKVLVKAKKSGKTKAQVVYLGTK